MPLKEPVAKEKASVGRHAAPTAVSRAPRYPALRQVAATSPLLLLRYPAQLQRAVGNQAVGRLLRGAGMLSGRPVVQRTLAVQNTLQISDIASINKVAAKVWILGGKAGDSVVIKVESPLAGEGAAGFAARHEYVTSLGQQIFSNMPDAKKLTDNEVQDLSGLTIQEGGGKGPPTLKEIARDSAQWGDVLFKVETVEMGQNLSDKIQQEKQTASSQPPGGWAVGNKTQALIKKPGTLRELGKMAVFDLLTNNQDRFAPLSTGNPVNIVNIDFSKTNEVMAIDNLDPNNRMVKDQWDGAPHLTDGKNRVFYANAAVRYLFEKAGITSGKRTPYTKAFLEGMNEAVSKVKGYVPMLKYLASSETAPEKKEMAEILWMRIDALQ